MEHYLNNHDAQDGRENHQGMVIAQMKISECFVGYNYNECYPRNCDVYDVN